MNHKIILNNLIRIIQCPHQREDLNVYWHRISRQYSGIQKFQMLVKFIKQREIEPLKQKGLNHHSLLYFVALLDYLWNDFLHQGRYSSINGKGNSKPRWMVVYHYWNPDDKCRPKNEVQGKDSAILGWKQRVDFSCLNESFKDKWLKRRYSDIDFIYRDTNAINRKIHRELLGVNQINSPRFKRPNLYYFHEKGSNGKEKIYHTHLLLPHSSNYGYRELYEYFNGNTFRSLKCVSHREIKIFERPDPPSILGYLSKECSSFNLSLDPYNSFTNQRK